MEETTQKTTKEKDKTVAPKKTVKKKTVAKKRARKVVAKNQRTKKKVENKFLAKLKQIHGKLNYRDLALAFLVLDAAVRLIG